MDFFAHQEAARRKTSVLIVYYVLAVVFIILGVYLAFAGTFVGFHAKATGAFDPAQAWNPELFLWVSGITLAVVALGSLYKTSQLAGGGAAVARMLGGRPVHPDTRDATERKILNIVEEMAIASGIQVPQVFVLDEEPGINAFAAGFTPGSAVVAVTRGCAEKLTRDELQGVIAHEFSHIFNGDMRLNLRLMGVLHGILVIAMAGYWILRSTSGRYRSRNSKNNGAPIALLGLALMIIGYVGVFFGKLIKSAVSRQREFLADASAVQFTRNPHGIAGALRKIAGYSAGSRMGSPNAEQASHLFFSNGLKQSFLGLMATHPPIEERIRRIDSSFPAEPVRTGSSTGGETAGAMGFAADPDEIVGRVGAPSPEHLTYARARITGIPEILAAAVRSPAGARGVVYCLLFSEDGNVRDRQMRILSDIEGGGATGDAARLREAVSALSAEYPLVLLDAAAPALRTMSAQEYGRFSRAVDAMINADQQVDLFEYTLRRILKRTLDPVFTRTKPGGVRFRDINALTGPLTGLLTSLAYWGADNESQARISFDKGAARLGVRNPLVMAGMKDAGLDAVDRAIETLGEASPTIKRQVVAACTACVAADGRVTVEEGELLRAVADSLDCPIPPFTAAA
jgi:Zn-dependent protease with chaperone function